MPGWLPARRLFYNFGGSPRFHTASVGSCHSMFARRTTAWRNLRTCLSRGRQGGYRHRGADRGTVSRAPAPSKPERLALPFPLVEARQALSAASVRKGKRGAGGCPRDRGGQACRRRRRAAMNDFGASSAASRRRSNRLVPGPAGQVRMQAIGTASIKSATNVKLKKPLLSTFATAPCTPRAQTISSKRRFLLRSQDSVNLRVCCCVHLLAACL